MLILKAGKGVLERDKQADEVVADEYGAKNCIFMLEEIKSILEDNIKNYDPTNINKRIEYIKELYHI